MMKKGIMFFLTVCCLAAYSAGNVNTEGHRGLVQTYSAKTMGFMFFDVGAGMYYAQDRTYLHKVVINGVNQAIGSASFISSTVHWSLGLTSFMDFAVSLPYYYDRAEIESREVTDMGIGDVVLSTKLLYPKPLSPRFFYQAYFFRATIPTATKNAGIFPRHSSFEVEDSKLNTPMTGSVYSPECFTFTPMMLLTLDFGYFSKQYPLQLHLNGGVCITGEGNRNDVALGAIALEYAPIKSISLFTEFSASSRIYNFKHAKKFLTDPLHILPGISVKTPIGLYFTVCGDLGLFTNKNYEYWQTHYNPVNSWNYATSIMPRYGFQLLAGWNGPILGQDDDRDGIKNDLDRCPYEAEDFDGYLDNDGCPDIDNDNDGVADSVDVCIDRPEDKDGFEDLDGCPDFDNDKDGINDESDICRNDPEDIDGYKDSDGCLDADNDKDGIADTLDKCPGEPEDLDGYVDNDGCPDLDNDGDNIPDLKDKCPNEPENINDFEDIDGCPDVKPEVKKSMMPMQQILEGIIFTTGKADLSPKSYPILDKIVEELKNYTDIVLEVRAHTDAVGKYDKNMQLSKDRAESVRQYLLSKGIEETRVTAVGFGATSPIGDNRTAAGRAKNRRVEIVRIK